jgi:Protein of unknown function (DUF1579)
MKKKFWTMALAVACSLMALEARSFADSAADSAPAAQGEMQLPPGWTMEDMQAMMEASTPGKMQEHLTEGVGDWKCATKMWMMPGSEPMTSEGTSKVTSLLDGRYIQVVMEGDMPGMGPYKGIGIYGFDNVKKEFVSTWIDNHGSGIMTGTGELSDDGKSIEWEYSGYCPINKKQITMREVESITGPNSRKLEMWGPEPKTGEVFKMMEIELTRD